MDDVTIVRGKNPVERGPESYDTTRSPEVEPRNNLCWSPAFRRPESRLKPVLQRASRRFTAQKILRVPVQRLRDQPCLFGRDEIAITAVEVA
jgi:hypothetical protein